MNQLQRLREEIVRVSLQAYNSGLFVGTSGNLSAYLREEDEMLITPTCARYETMAPEDVVRMKPDGTILEGSLQPSSEWRMHAAIFRRRPEACAVFHTHSPYATAFATLRRGVPCILIEMAPFLGGDIPCARFAQPGTDELGDSAADAMGDARNGCLLGSHGVLTVGADIGEAFIRAEYAEEAARIYHLALQAGEPVVLG